MGDQLQEDGKGGGGYWIAKINDLIEKCMSHLKLMGFINAARVEKSCDAPYIPR